MYIDRDDCRCVFCGIVSCKFIMNIISYEYYLQNTILIYTYNGILNSKIQWNTYLRCSVRKDEVRNIFPHCGSTHLNGNSAVCMRIWSS